MSLRHKILLGTTSVLSLFLLGACARLPDNSQRVPSQVIEDGDSVIFMNYRSPMWGR